MLELMIELIRFLFGDVRRVLVIMVLIVALGGWGLWYYGDIDRDHGPGAGSRRR